MQRERPWQSRRRWTDAAAAAARCVLGAPLGFRRRLSHLGRIVQMYSVEVGVDVQCALMVPDSAPKEMPAVGAASPPPVAVAAVPGAGAAAGTATIAESFAVHLEWVAHSHVKFARGASQRPGRFTWQPWRPRHSPGLWGLRPDPPAEPRAAGLYGG